MFIILLEKIPLEKITRYSMLQEAHILALTQHTGAIQCGRNWSKGVGGGGNLA